MWHIIHFFKSENFAKFNVMVEQLISNISKHKIGVVCNIFWESRITRLMIKKTLNFSLNEIFKRKNSLNFGHSGNRICIHDPASGSCIITLHKERKNCEMCVIHLQKSPENLIVWYQNNLYRITIWQTKKDSSYSFR